MISLMVGLIVIIIILIFFLFTRNKQAVPGASLEELRNELGRLEKILHEESVRSREENSNNAKLLREEISGSIKTLGEYISGTLTEMSKAQKEQLCNDPH